MIDKKISQAKFLFPKSQYPFYHSYIELLSLMLVKHELKVSKCDMEIIALAFGRPTHIFFHSVCSKPSLLEQLDSLVTEGLPIKVEAKKYLSLRNSELSADSNRAVIELILSQYRLKLDEIEALKQQEQLEQKLAQQKAQDELKAQTAALLKKNTEARQTHLANLVDFDDFDIYHVKKNSRVDKLLTQLRRKPLSSDEMKWLHDIGFCNELIEQKNHIQLAHQHYQNWKQKNMPWELVNASAAYRKGGELKKIRKTLNEQYPFAHAGKDKKLKSALLTTFGGVCRDQEDFTRGIELGHEAHKVTPLNFRPCTLLGAIYLSTGEFDLGHEWYGKAKDRGFTQNAYDNDIKSVYFRACDEIKSRLKQNLIATGHKYDWLSKP
ncbi:hypothetical protein [Shewanella baltica]|uniref:hypothetical protein n=1 Tax=Shewanella baltica TaxID=62322 RepID=UPI00131EF3A8|nr:hypothetical protein [Shewanella baltica]